MSKQPRDVPYLTRHPGSPNWYIAWYDPATGRVRRRSTGSECDREAQAQLGRFILARAEVEKDEPKPEPVRRRIALRAEECRVEDVIEWYLTDRAPALEGDGSKTAAYNAQALLKHLTGVRVADLTPAALKAYEDNRNADSLKARKKPISRATIRRDLSVLGAAVARAVKEGRLAGAPKIGLPSAPPGRKRHLSEIEVGSLLAECHDQHIKLFVALAVNTGARRGAILDLTWPQIDFVNGVIDLNPPGRAQTAKRRPVVPMSDSLGEMLREAQAAAKSPYVIAYHGMPILAVKTGLGNAAKRAGLSGVTAHVLRHTAGTLLAKAGVPLWIIGQLLGHSIVKTTELYAQFSPDFGREAVAILGKLTAKSGKRV